MRKLKIFIFIILLISASFSIQMELVKISNAETGSQSIYPGDTVYAYLKVINDDKTVYNDVSIDFEPQYPLEIRDYLSYSQKIDQFLPGDTKIFIFAFKVPKDINPGEYYLKFKFEGKDVYSPSGEIKTFSKKFYIKINKRNYFYVNITDIISKKGILTLNLKIRSQIPAKRVIVEFNPLNGLSIIGNQEVFLGNFGMNETKMITKKFYISNLLTGTYPLKILISWIDQNNFEHKEEKTFYVFIENNENKNFKLICSPNEIEEGLNEVRCVLKNLNNKTIKFIQLPGETVGNRIIYDNNFKVKIFANKIGIYSFCVSVNYLDKDQKTYSESDCYNFLVKKPYFDIKLGVNTTNLVYDKVNNVLLTINSNKILNNIKVKILGEVIGSDVFYNITKIPLKIKPEKLNYINVILLWSYKNVQYMKNFSIYFNIVKKIENNQIFVFYDPNSKTLGIANRGKNKIYHCVLYVQGENSTLLKYIGDLEEDDYDSIVLKNVYGNVKINVSCYDEEHHKIVKSKSFYIKPIKNKSSLNILYLLIFLLLVFGILFLIFKRLKKE